jgi:hypothetical protein
MQKGTSDFGRVFIFVSRVASGIFDGFPNAVKDVLMKRDYTCPQELDQVIHNTLKAGLHVSVCTNFQGWGYSTHAVLLENIGLPEKTALCTYLPYYSPSILSSLLENHHSLKYGGKDSLLIAMWERRARYVIDGQSWRSEIPAIELSDPASSYYLEPKLLKQYQERLKSQKPVWEKACWSTIP